MTEPFDWTTDAESTGDPLDQVAYVEAPLDPYIVADDLFAPALDETGQYVLDEPVLDWVEVSTDAIVDVSYDRSDGSDWLVMDPAVPLDPGYVVLDDGFAYTDTDAGWIDLGTGSCECTDIGLSTIDVPTGWDAAPIALEVPQPADDAVYQSPQAETTPVVAFDPGFLAEPIVESIEPANMIVVGGTDFFGQDAAENVSTINIGGTDVFDNVTTGDPNSGGTVIGGTDMFGTVPGSDPNSGGTVIGGTDMFGTVPGGGVSTIDGSNIAVITGQTVETLETIELSSPGVDDYFNRTFGPILAVPGGTSSSLGNDFIIGLLTPGWIRSQAQSQSMAEAAESARILGPGYDYGSDLSGYGVVIPIY
jgi:hypothetical protein